MTFLLDANVIIDFQNAGLLDEFATMSKMVSIAVVEEVFDEVTFPREYDSDSSKHKKRTALTALSNAKLDKLEILAGTPEKAFMDTIRAPRSSSKQKDQGEAASIAVAKTAPHLVFVTRDDNATFWALNELYGSGERVMRVPVFIRTMFERGALPASAVQRIAGQLRNIRAIPSWWDVWLSAIAQMHSQISASAFSQN